MKIKCKNADYTSPPGALQKDQVYEAIAMGTTHYTLLSPKVDGIWYKDRFEILESSEGPKSVRSQSRECPCGIARADCTYHSDS